MDRGPHNISSAQLCSQLCDDLSVAIIVIAYPSGEFIYVNQKVLEDLSLPLKSIAGKHYKEYFWPEFYQVYEELARECQDGDEHTTVYYWTEKVLWEQISAKMITWHDDSPKDDEQSVDRDAQTKEQVVIEAQAPVGSSLAPGQKAIMLNITNITEVARKEHEYQRTAYFDDLTELPNAKKLELDISELTSYEDVSLIYFQIQNIDDIIDLYGWGTSDDLHLLIRDWLIESDPGRTQFYKGGRGFIVMNREITREGTIKRIEEIIERFNHPWSMEIDGNTIDVYSKIRVGGVLGEYVKDEVRTRLLRTIIMDKKQGAEYTIYDAAEEARVKANHKMHNDLIRCILDGMKGFSVSYQPIAEAVTGRWVGLEALCRWKSPSGKQVPPAQFIPAAEQLGFVNKLDNWVRREAMETYSRLNLQKKNAYLDVNFSPGQPIDEAYILGLFEDIRETHFPIDNLIIEITEAEKLPFDETNLKGLEALRRLRIMLSLDDFGTGYSSLENLLKVAATSMKTDKILVDNIEEKADLQYLLDILINLAHHMGMQIIVEGVETESQRKFLVEHGADYIQGYYFSKPLTAEQLAEAAWHFDTPEEAL